MHTSTKPKSSKKKTTAELAEQLSKLERKLIVEPTFSRTFDLYDSIWPQDDFWLASRETQPSEELIGVLKTLGEMLPGTRKIELHQCFEIASHGIIHGSAEFDGKLALFFGFTGIAMMMIGVLEPETSTVIYHRLSMLPVPDAPIWFRRSVGVA